MRKATWLAVFVVVLVGIVLVVGKPRGPRPPRPADLGALDPKAVVRVSASYEKDVRPLVQRACFDCHSDKTVWPWYHSLPGVQQYLDHHVAEGRHDLDLGLGVPFNPTSPLDRHLRRIARVVKTGQMPLWDYALMHKDARLSDAEKQVIVQWAQDALADLSATAKPL